MQYRNLYPALALLLGCGFAACSDSDNNDPEPTPLPAGPVEIEVIDYSPAPGQFINEIPAYDEGDSKASIAAKAGKALNAREMISLGAWGGSVTLRLKTPIYNGSGNDFRVLGNSYYSGTNDRGEKYGSCEPGIVYVMQDANGNGKPDDGQWLELSGDKTDGAPIVSVTYTKCNKEILWSCTDGTSGTIPQLDAFHPHTYFPKWISGETLTFSGRRLPDNGVYNEATTNFDLYCYTGYADARPNNEPESGLDISSAIDSNGVKTNVESIDFVRIVTGVLQVNGHLGECSTEVSGIERL